jgi:hypothetical protein
MNRAELTAKIRHEYGTVKRFCFTNGINYNTWNVVMQGRGKSKRITDILISQGYIVVKKH